MWETTLWGFFKWHTEQNRMFVLQALCPPPTLTAWSSCVVSSSQCELKVRTFPKALHTWILSEIHFLPLLENFPLCEWNTCPNPLSREAVDLLFRECWGHCPLGSPKGKSWKWPHTGPEMCSGLSRQESPWLGPWASDSRFRVCQFLPQC